MRAEDERGGSSAHVPGHEPPAADPQEANDERQNEQDAEDVEQRLEELREQLAPLCRSKAEEMALWGYDQVDPDLIWKVAAEDVRKKRTLKIHQVANAILSMKPNRLMDYLMKEMYRKK